MVKLCTKLALLVCISSFSQTKIEPNIQTSKTLLTVLQEDKFSEILKSSMNQISNDTISAKFSNIGLGGTAIGIELTEHIKPKLFLWSDYDEFDGKHQTELNIESYSIILNKKNSK